MGKDNDALLEIIKTENGLRFTFLDRTHPSLSYEQSLRVPKTALEKIALDHNNILVAISRSITRRSSSDGKQGNHEELNTEQQIHDLSETIRQELFPEGLLRHIREFSPSSLLIRTDSPHIPWEISRINGDVLGLKLPTGRSLLTHRPLAKHFLREARRTLRILIIANPTEDLDGADIEANCLTELFDQSPFFEYQILQRKEANFHNVSAMLRKHKFDVIHYAGHSDYVYESGNDEGGRDNSAILLNDTSILPEYFSKLVENNPPILIFLNSCNSGVVENPKHFFDDLTGIAPYLLRVSVEAVIGASWPVIDETAVAIAKSFYELVARGYSIGYALNEAREGSGIDSEIPYWLGYSLFGDPNRRLLDDNSWKVHSIRSGGRAAALSTFTKRASLHVSSLHSYLMSAHETDTSAVGFACECLRSEALVVRKDINLDDILKAPSLRVGVPGTTGSSIFLRKILAERGIDIKRCQLIELDTAEVSVGLQNEAIDATVLWEPDLSLINRDKFEVIYSNGDHEYTICVLVARTPRTPQEVKEISYALDVFERMAGLFRQNSRKWALLLAEQMGVELGVIQHALKAYDFKHAGTSRMDKLPSSIQAFIQNEVSYLRDQNIISADFDEHAVLMSHDYVQADSYVNNQDISDLFVDVQWSPSSLPLLMGKFLGHFK